MPNGRKLGRAFVVFAMVVAGSFSVWPAYLQAQYSGDNVVYSSPTQTGNSHAFIDASAFSGSDICVKINTALVQLANQATHPGYGGAAVVDARGITSSLGCSISPWTGISSPPPSTILLPAGTIVITGTWVLPNGTRIVGQGSPGVGTGTVIQAQNFTGTAMIKMGSSSLCGSSGICTGVSVENLRLDGNGVILNGIGINGIVNQYSGDLSYVDKVSLYQILGTGLLVSTNANNSGPYSDITFDSGSFPAVGPCVSIYSLSSTRGIHGLTCISPSTEALAAVLLDSSNNTLADVRIVGFYDGISVGKNNPAHSNVLRNVYGDTAKPNCKGCITPVNVVHIFNVGGNPVSDLVVMGVSNGGQFTTTIQDDLTGPTLADPHVAMYVLGRQATGATGYSRFTTSPNAATWVVGSGAPSGNCPSNAGGSLYSNTSGSGTALYVCPVGGGVAWKGIM
jgi:hypothetical protein